ncbi:MAG TPA: hypothetical protein VF307_06105, partial [Candidatus Nanopelagicaceae bacterium]
MIERIFVLLGTFAIAITMSGCATPNTPTPNSSTSTNAASRTVTCADGGTCVIGDIGPGGGFIFNVSALCTSGMGGSC